GGRSTNGILPACADSGGARYRLAGSGPYRPLRVVLRAAPSHGATLRHLKLAALTGTITVESREACWCFRRTGTCIPNGPGTPITGRWNGHVLTRWTWGCRRSRSPSTPTSPAG